MIKVEIEGKMLEFETRSSFDEYLKSLGMGVDADGNIFREEGRGVVPTILDIWFKERVEYRKLAGDYGKAGDKEKESYYDRRQKRQKIFLNSVYGCMGLPVWRFYDRDNAEAVTLSGQTIILNAEKLIISMYEEKLGGRYKITYDDGTHEIIYKNQTNTTDGRLVKDIFNTPNSS
jgi:DNA polymerase elongation subunit (family B)